MNTAPINAPQVSRQGNGASCVTAEDRLTPRADWAPDAHQPQKGNPMKTLITIAALLAAPAHAGDYVDARGCTHIDKGGYFNIGLEPGCDRDYHDDGPRITKEEDK